MAGPLLTIAIPTYNRCDRLLALLKSILEDQPGVAASAVEIVVSDNASTDGTGERLRAHAEARRIVYRRNAGNLGYDGNIAALLPAASGEFIWIMGDDDRVAPGALPRLLGLLADNPPDTLILPARGEDEPDSANHAATFGLPGPTAAPALSDFLNRFGLFGILGGAGLTVFRRRHLTGLDVYPAMGTKFCHVFLVAGSFARRPSLFRPETYFITPAFDAAAKAAYERRWQEEGLMLHAWYQAFLALMRLLKDGSLPAPQGRDFFRMMSRQSWPLHYHVYATLWGKLYRREEIPADQWEDLRLFDQMLGAAEYTNILNGLQQAFTVQASLLQMTHGMIAHPTPIYPPIVNT